MKTINLVKIKARRKELKITHQEMAEALGLNNASSYYRREKGEYKFEAGSLHVLSKKLKLKMSDLFFDQDFAKTANQ